MNSMRRIILSLAVIALVLSAGAASAAKLAKYSFTTIAFPGAKYTTVSTIKAGVVVGNYLDANDYTHGFRWAHGIYTSIDFPGANETIVNGINAFGEIVGQYSDANWLYHGFRWAHGDYTPIDYPGAAQTMALGINASGRIVGQYFNSGDQWSHGFFLSGHSFTAIDYPGDVNTHADKINICGQILGAYGPLTHFIHYQHPFLLEGHVYTSIVVPGARDLRTFAYDINNSGQIVGEYQEGGTGLWYGFLRRHGGAYITINYPGATYAGASGINNSGDIVGYYYDANGQKHGFLRSDGAYSTIDYPGFPNTEATQITDAKQIIGTYNDGGSCFIATPSATARGVVTPVLPLLLE
jgi:probable HAF family extracellular repeat protein